MPTELLMSTLYQNVQASAFDMFWKEQADTDLGHRRCGSAWVEVAQGCGRLGAVDLAPAPFCCALSCWLCFVLARYQLQMPCKCVNDVVQYMALDTTILMANDKPLPGARSSLFSSWCQQMWKKGMHQSEWTCPDL